MRLLDLEGFHIVKRIDGFHLSTEMSGRIDVHIDLEVINDPNFKPSSLDTRQVQELLGNDGLASGRRCVRLSIPAGELHFFEVGQVLLDGRLHGTLPGDLRKVSCLDPVESGMKDTRGFTDRPKNYTSKIVLTRKEFWAGDSENNQFLIFKHRDVEYVLPKMVVFKTFYCVSTTFVHEVLSGPWNMASQALAIVEPPRETAAGVVWPLMPLNMNASTPSAVRQLALFLFSDHARRCINRLHSDRLRAHGEPWFNTANIPHDTGPGLGMSVHGYPLPKYETRGHRFLITRIFRCDWRPAELPPERPLTIEKLHLVADPGAEGASGEAGGPGFPRPVRVPGDPNATLGFGVDPSKGSDYNTFAVKPLEYSNAPTIVVTERTKAASASGSSRHVREGKPADRVSGGLGVTGDDRPGHLEVDQEHRVPSQHLEALPHVLDRLRDGQVIDGYQPDGPAIGSPFCVFRNGQASWSLAGADTGPEWHSSQEDSGSSWPWVWEPEAKANPNAPTKPKKKYARVLAVYRVTIAQWQGLLMDIECRPTSLHERYRLFLVEVENEKPLFEDDMEPCLTALRNAEGVLWNEASELPAPVDDKKPRKERVLLRDAFASLHGTAHGKKHHGVTDHGEDAVQRQNAKTLGLWLLKVAARTQKYAVVTRRARLQAMKA